MRFSLFAVLAALATPGAFGAPVSSPNCGVVPTDTTTTNTTTNNIPTGNTLLVNSTDVEQGNTGFLQKNGLLWGWLPESVNGKETMVQLNQALGSKAKYYGWYAHINDNKDYQSQIKERFDDVVSSGAIYQISVMPNSYNGVTKGDNSAAVEIANMLKEYTDAKVEVWLRFGHEMNWYTTDGTYPGGPAEFKEAWTVMADAVASICPEVKMFWCPNNAGSIDEITPFYPEGSRVDVVGLDIYPKTTKPQPNDILRIAQPFHDKYASETVPFVLGETGLSPKDEDASWENKLQLAEMLTTDVKSSLKYFQGVSWFNYDKYENGKQTNFRLVNDGHDDELKAWFAQQ